jgi:ATP-dependent DNA helicase RecG
MANNESQNTEYKESWRDEYLKWICGFANAQGGRIFIGIDDNGSIVGIDNYQKLLEDIPNKVISHLGLMIDTNLHQKDEKNYIEIVISTSSVPISYHCAYYYRTDSTKQELKGTALQEFLVKKIGKTLDDILVENASWKEIDENAIQVFLKKALSSKRISPNAAQEDVKTLLINLHLANEDGKLKNATLLLFGKDPLKYFTTAYFKIGRFGSSDSDLRFQDVIEGNILEMPDRVMEMLRAKYLVSPIRYEGLQRIEELEYPEQALREAVLNAIVHKDYTGTTIQLSVYDDKLILWNPGNLPSELSLDMLRTKHPSKPRNKNIAEIFFKAGHIEAWGRGISKIMDACSLAGLPDPLIEEHAGGIQLTFLKDIYREDYLKELGLEDKQIKVLLYIKQNGSITNSKYQELVNTSWIQVANAMH